LQSATTARRRKERLRNCRTVSLDHVVTGFGKIARS
jgi:hypothetical protein